MDTVELEARKALAQWNKLSCVSVIIMRKNIPWLACWSKEGERYTEQTQYQPAAQSCPTKTNANLVCHWDRRVVCYSHYYGDNWQLHLPRVNHWRHNEQSRHCAVLGAENTVSQYTHCLPSVGSHFKRRRQTATHRLQSHMKNALW